jgi:NitT/TauT family transport system ATP-binding protein
MFHFAEVEGGDIKLTDTGKQFAELGTDDRKKLFQKQLLAFIPLATHIRRVLQERANHVAPKSRFLDELEDHMSTEDAEHTLRAVTAWGRYAEAFAYDDDAGMFSLENPS